MSTVDSVAPRVREAVVRERGRVGGEEKWSQLTAVFGAGEKTAPPGNCRDSSSN